MVAMWRLYIWHNIIIISFMSQLKNLLHYALPYAWKNIVPVSQNVLKGTTVMYQSVPGVVPIPHPIH